MGQPLLKVHMSPATQPSLTPTSSPLRIIGPGGSGRDDVETFLARGYRESFGAQLRSHYPLIGGTYGPDGRVSAAAGLRFAQDEPLFLERYLDRPVEDALAPIYRELVTRADIVEIGSLVSSGSGAALELFASLADWVGVEQGRRFAVATVTPRLEGLLRRAGFGLTKVAWADPARVACAERDWGQYYQGGPSVVTGRTHLSGALADLRRARVARAAARRHP